MMTLLLINGGHEALAGIRLARALGLFVVVSDGDPDAPGFELADDHFIASTYDAAETVRAAVQYHRQVRPLDGVICLAADVPVSVASVAHALGLPGLSLESARLSVNKLAMKRCFAAHDLPVPWFSPVIDADHLCRIVEERSVPLVLKPIDSRGSRGVLQIRNGLDLDWAFLTAMFHSPSGRVMVEEFLDGPQISSESIVVEGVAFTPGLADRNYEHLDRYAPFIIENGGELPAQLSDESRQAINRLIEQAAAALGISNGVIKGDLVLHHGQPHLIEVAARLSGGFFCTHEIPLSTGVSTIHAAVQLALGQSVDRASLQPRFHRGAVQRRLFLEPGRVTAVTGVEAARRLPGVQELFVRARPGMLVSSQPTDSTAIGAVVVTDAETREIALRRAEEALQTIQIEIEPRESICLDSPLAAVA